MNKRNNAWNNFEMHGAVEAYFQLLESQRRLKKVNKSALYRELSAKFPSRTIKAFEYKFQNISAILYEEKLPYADGLRPMGHYQEALKCMVLEYVKKSDSKRQSPIEILVEKLRRLRLKNYLSIRASGSGRYGLTLEQYLNIPQNSSKSPDFMGIELKTNRFKGLQTLFSRVPTRYLACDDKNQLLDKFGYFDAERNRNALYTSFNNQPDTLGFYLLSNKKNVLVKKQDVDVMLYEAGTLESALLEKHNETAYIQVSSKRENREEKCRFDKLLYCKSPSLNRFLNMTNQGNVFLNLTMSKKHGKTKDHGFLWRVPHEALEELYQNTQLIDLNE